MQRDAPRVMLLWLPEGAAPSTDDFAPGGQPAGDGLLQFRTFEDAVRYAHRVDPLDRAGKAPWILLDQTIMAPEDVMALNTPPARIA
jgi:hypothetical protein